MATRRRFGSSQVEPTVFIGTNRADTLIGTDGDDLFKPKTGHDSVDGAGGFDTLDIDYSNSPVANGAVSSFTTHADGFDGYVEGGARSICKFSGIEALNFVGSRSDDLVVVGLTLPLPGLALDIDGGAGANVLSLFALKAGGPVDFEVGGDGVATSEIGRFAHFQTFALALSHHGDHAVTSVGADIVHGNGGGDTLDTRGGDDQIFGGRGDDVLLGGDGDDRLAGGHGGDSMAGGTGADVFSFGKVADFGTDVVDRIVDFDRADGDTIDLSQIDPDHSAHGDQAFTFIGTAAFTGTGGTTCELRFENAGAGAFTVQGDLDHDGAADFSLVVQTGAMLEAADFAL